MRNYLAVVFDDTNKAYEGLPAMWQLEDEGAITGHGTTVVHRNDWGEYQVDAKDTHPGLATAVGVSIGALIGALAGPAGGGGGGGSAPRLEPPRARRSAGRRAARLAPSRISGAQTLAISRGMRPVGCSALANLP